MIVNKLVFVLLVFVLLVVPATADPFWGFKASAIVESKTDIKAPFNITANQSVNIFGAWGVHASPAINATDKVPLYHDFQIKHVIENGTSAVLMENGQIEMLCAVCLVRGGTIVRIKEITTVTNKPLYVVLAVMGDGRIAPGWYNPETRIFSPSLEKYWVDFYSISNFD